jgi:hypothetical protein
LLRHWLVFFTWWTRCLSTGTPRNKLQPKWWHMRVNSFLLECASTKLWIYISPSGISASQSGMWATCSGVTRLSLIAQPHVKLHKQHNALSFHHVREVIALKYVLMMLLSGKDNPSDILSKHWGHQAIYLILKPILFFSGNTANLIDNETTITSGSTK